MILPDKLPDGVLKNYFPKLEMCGYAITSESTHKYNCIAWVAYDTQNKWWPVHDPRYYWPASVAPREETLACFVKAFETLGYKRCSKANYEEGYEKIAFYVHPSTRVPTHSARQLTQGDYIGQWTSKLGDSFDIVHTVPEGVEGPVYGTVAQIMKRKVQPMIDSLIAADQAAKLQADNT